MKNRKGFTLIELIIIIAIFGITAAVLVPMFIGDIKEEAEAGMLNYVSILYPNFSDIKCNCTGKDSDGDGYVRCSATGLDNRTEKREMIVAECDKKGNCAPIANIDQ